MPGGHCSARLADMDFLVELEPREAGCPGMRCVLLHSLAHTLMWQFMLQCGCDAAGVRERLHSRGASDDREPILVLIFLRSPTMTAKPGRVLEA